MDADDAPRPLRVAVVGAGPAGLFTVQALVEQDDVPVRVEVLDRLPTPFGLLRYGVAPDHPEIRSIRDRFATLLHRDEVGFVGGVEVGRDLPVAELREHVDAVVYSYGTSSDRHLGVPGEDLLGSLPASALVAWYCGHPDADRPLVEDALAAGGDGVRSAVVVGAGNVALDVARVLAKSPHELAGTDMADHVLEHLAPVTPAQVHVLVRRGPAHVAFSTPELRELGRLDDAAVVLADPAVDLDDPPGAPRPVMRNLAVLREWASAPEPPPERRRVALHFWSRPVGLFGDGPPGRERVRRVVVEPTALDGDGRLVAAGEPHELAADLVVRAVGYHGTGLPGVPFDETTGTVPNEAGRVLRAGHVAPGEYVTGWIKRGPQGVIGTNKPDARETAHAVLDDAAALAAGPDPGGVAAWLAGRGTPVVTVAGWDRIDAAEVALGLREGRARATLADRAAMMAAASGRDETAGARDGAASGAGDGPGEDAPDGRRVRGAAQASGTMRR